MTSRRKLRALAALVLLGTALSGSPPLGAATGGSATLTVIVENLRSPKGKLHVAIWNSPDGFTDAERTLAGAARPANRGEIRFVFDKLAPGRYAVAAYHDENGNDEFDRTTLGLPAEGLGFSNNAWLTVLGAPSFEKAAIELDGTAADAVVTLRY